MSIWAYRLAVLCAVVGFAAHSPAQDQTRESDMGPRIVGMYIHQHWSYKHPYAARTWTLEDWRGYVDGLHRLGYNTVMVWPVLETMPNPLTESDRRNLERISSVIDMVHGEFGMRLLIALCPNVMAKDEEASKYTFEDRPFFHTDRRVDPGDDEAMARMMAWREELFRPLAKADGVSIIDSDPGGYPGSTNEEFVRLLAAHRRMLDRLRPGIELYYWIHVGWQAYCDYYRTAEFRMGKQEEIEDTLRRLRDAKPEPWGILSGWGPQVGEGLGLKDRTIAFRYGAIEGEPSFPMTNFGGDTAWQVGATPGARGVMGNAQSHCLQIPNTFAFARGAQGKPVTESDYVELANNLLAGQGSAIVQAWKALAGVDADTMRAARAEIGRVKAANPQPGPLKGLLFGDPQRFLDDLAMQLDAKAALEDFRAEVFAELRDEARVKTTFSGFVTAIDAWQRRHGYQNQWSWERMEQALVKLDDPGINATLESRTYKGQGATPFEQVQNGFSVTESLTTRLIQAMKEAAAGM